MSKIMYMDEEYAGRVETVATQSVNGLMSSTDKIKLDGLPHIYISTSDPTSADGNDGDIWIKYAALA